MVFWTCVSFMGFGQEHRPVKACEDGDDLMSSSAIAVKVR
jgi:hypothetical protein